jgi:hypothetical protein
MFFNPRYNFKKKEYQFVMISSVLALIMYTYLRFILGGSTAIIVHNTYTPIINAPLDIKLLTLPKIIFYYIYTFIFPKDLAVAQMWLVKNMDIKNFYIPLVTDILFIISLIIAYIHLVKKRTKEIRSFAFFLIWFLLSWIFSWQIIPLDMTVADRWFYLPMIGLLGIIGTVLSSIKFLKSKYQHVLIIIVVVYIVFLSIRTTIRNTNWNDGITLFTHDEVISSQSFDLEEQLGYLYILQQDYDKAKLHLDKAIQLAPTFSDIWNNLGVYYEAKNEIDKSIWAFSQTIKNDPNYTVGYFNIAMLSYKYKHDYTQSSYYIHQLLLHNQSPYYYYLAGYMDYKSGNKTLGIEEVKQAYSLSSDERYLNTYTQMVENNLTLELYTN